MVYVRMVALQCMHLRRCYFAVHHTSQPCVHEQPCTWGKGVSACSSAVVLYFIYM
jgi:hypothetical protein